MLKRGICLLGSTGSIGQSVLAVIKENPALFEVIALTAHTSIEMLFRQCCEFAPLFAVLSNKEQAAHLQERLNAHQCATRVLSGVAAFKTITSHPRVHKVVSAIVGAAGLEPTLYAIEAGKEVIIANKEPLVMAGELLIREADKSGAVLLPADSEHNAIFQCLPKDYKIGKQPKGVTKLFLTASGGPFLDTPYKDFMAISPEMACQHPNWKMGKKITVDCATMMNKGLEVIEASRLFGLHPAQIEVVVHPQSIMHSMVEYEDCSVLAQCGPHDMRVPLAYCLGWPQRISCGVPKLSFLEVGKLTFLPPDKEKFRCLALAYQALTLGKAAPAVLNASNEIVVDAFLSNRLRFTDIPAIIESVLDKHYDLPCETLEEIIHADSLAREKANQLIHAKSLN